ncbi:MAG: hypothetical protein QOE92_1656 [Chloroflexota bacterium]|nr:hypothetical protein [Chloroflexota bacterium]
MNPRRQIAGCVAAVIALAALATPITASAAKKPVCEFSATVTMYPAIAPAPARGGAGLYSLRGSATCTRGAKRSTYGLNGNYGLYSNTVCGVETLSGDMSFLGDPQFHSRYRMDVVGGAARITSELPQGYGTAAVEAQPAGACLTKPASAFQVTGVIAFLS